MSHAAVPQGETGIRRPSIEPRKALTVLGGLLAVAVIIALLLGPPGSASAPTSGIAATFHQHATYVVIVVAVIAWVLWLFREPASDAVVRPLRSTWEESRAFWRKPEVVWSGRGVALLVAVLLPFVTLPAMGTRDFSQEVLVGNIAPYVLLAVGLNVVVGFAGLLDLGYIAFYAVGAYATAYFTGALPAQPPFHLNPFWTIPIAIVVAMITGVILGAPTLRLRGDYLAIVTLGFGLIIALVADNLPSITGGPNGNVQSVPTFSFFGYKFPLEIVPGDHLPWYYLILGLTIIVIVLFRFLEHSRVGRAWVAIREDEVAAESVGINPLKYKVMAFAIGASTSGLAGAFFASKTGTFTPDVFSFQQSVLVLVFVIVGGMGSTPGVILGAAVLQYLPQALRGYAFYHPANLYAFVGILLIVMMIFRPQGLIPSRRRARELHLAEEHVGSADALAAPGGAP